VSRPHAHTHVDALLAGALDVADDVDLEAVRSEGLRRLLAALERHEEVGPGYARTVGRSVAIDLLRRRRAADARRRRAAERSAEAAALARKHARLLAAVRRRAEHMRPLLTPTQARDVDAALARLAALYGTEGAFCELEEDRRARQLRDQARRRGLVLLSEGRTVSGRRVCSPASASIREWIAGRPGGHVRQTRRASIVRGPARSFR
jgi:hypothetical protein